MKFKSHIKDVKKLNEFKIFCANDLLVETLCENGHDFLNLYIMTKTKLRAIHMVAVEGWTANYIIFEYIK